MNTVVDDNGLEVTVTSVAVGPATSTGAQLFVAELEFFNTTSQPILLHSKLWVIEVLGGARIHAYMGSTEDDAFPPSNFEIHELAAGGRFSGHLMFAATLDDVLDASQLPELVPMYVLYTPSTLERPSEEYYVTWYVGPTD